MAKTLYPPIPQTERFSLLENSLSIPQRIKRISNSNAGKNKKNK